MRSAKYSFEDNKIIYVENPKQSASTQWGWTSHSSDVAGDKIDIQKLIEFLYTSKEQLENEIKKYILQ